MVIDVLRKVCSPSASTFEASHIGYRWCPQLGTGRLNLIALCGRQRLSPVGHELGGHVTPLLNTPLSHRPLPDVFVIPVESCAPDQNVAAASGSDARARYRVERNDCRADTSVA